MKIFKKLCLILSVIFLLNTNTIYAQEEVQAPIISDWSVLSVDNAQKKGIVPINMPGKDYTKNITLEELKDLNENTEKKLKSFNLEFNNNFKPVEIINDLSRKDILFNLYNLIGQYDKNISNFTNPIDALKEIDVLVGNGNNFNLDKTSTFEETATFYNRALDYVANKNNIGSKGFFYKIDNNGNTVYLLGSIHLGDYDMYPIQKQIIDAFYDSDEIYVEVDTLNNEELNYMIDLMPRTDGTKLSDDLDSTTYQKLKKYMDGYEIPEENYNNLKIWAAYNQISNVPIAIKKPFGNALGIDNHFVSTAKILGTPIGELESVKLQTDTLANYSESEYKKMLVDLIEDLDKNGEKNQIASVEMLQHAWINGDTEFLKSMSNPDDSFSQLLLSDRDPKMAEKIAQFLNSKDKKTYFIIAGALHYVPENSVIKYLKDMGFMVVDLNSKNITN